MTVILLVAVALATLIAAAAAANAEPGGLAGWTAFEGQAPR